MYKICSGTVGGPYESRQICRVTSAVCAICYSKCIPNKSFTLKMKVKVTEYHIHNGAIRSVILSAWLSSRLVHSHPSILLVHLLDLLPSLVHSHPSILLVHLLDLLPSLVHSHPSILLVHPLDLLPSLVHSHPSILLVHLLDLLPSLVHSHPSILLGHLVYPISPVYQWHIPKCVPVGASIWSWNR